MIESGILTDRDHGELIQDLLEELREIWAFRSQVLEVLPLRDKRFWPIASDRWSGGDRSHATGNRSYPSLTLDFRK